MTLIIIKQASGPSGSTVCSSVPSLMFHVQLYFLLLMNYSFSGDL